MTRNDEHGREDLDFGGVVAGSSNKYDISLEIQPKKISVPAEVEFTIINQMEVPYKFSPDKHPVVFSNSESGWQRLQVAERLRFTEEEVVDDKYSFTQEIPYSNWNPKVGEYLMLIYGRVLTDDGEVKVNLADKIEIV